MRDFSFAEKEAVRPKRGEWKSGVSRSGPLLNKPVKASAEVWFKRSSTR